MSEDIFYHTTSGAKLRPSGMALPYLKNAILSLEKKKETDVPIYAILKEELKKREDALAKKEVVA
jgi:hypothetical protein